MSIRVKVWALGFALVCLAASGFGQEATKPGDASLADIARHLKADKAKEPKTKPAMVLTNDSITRSDDQTGFSATNTTKGNRETSTPDSAAGAKHDAEYFRSRQSKLEDELDTHKRELSVLQQKLGQNQMQYYPNPQESLMQQYSRGDIDKLTAQIDAKKQQIQDDEKALLDLHDQLRREGGDPGWLR